MTDTISLPTHDDLDEHDRLELVAFTSKVEHEGLGYALWQYKPTFHHVGLQAVIDQTSQGYALLNGWLEDQDDAVTAFWGQPDAIEQYDAHMRAEEEARRAARES